MEVTYSKAKYSTRCFAFALDLLLMVITTLLLMLGIRNVVSNAEFYKTANQKINDIQLASHLYVEKDNGLAVIMSDYYTANNEEEMKELNSKFDNALTLFYSDPIFFDQSNPESGLYLYNIQKIPNGSSSDLFIYEDSSHTTIVAKSSATTKQLYDFYCDAMNGKALSYLNNSDEYIANSRIISLSFIFIILAIPVIISIIVYELIIPSIIFRGKKTLGKFAFKLSVIDVRGLSPSYPRFLARFGLIFLEIILSIITFMIPLIISFSMFVFSRRGQSFHDYVTNTYVVEAPWKSICITKEEMIAKHKNDSNFDLQKKDVHYE